MNLKLWDEMVAKFGIGKKLGVDLPSEVKGNLPDVDYYNKIYKGVNTWKFSNIYSLAIGEGEIDVSPMKMANVAAILANRGYYITPHIVKGVGQKGVIAKDFSVRKYVDIDRKHFDVVADGMERMTEGKPIFPADLGICGKTGTSQNAKGKDHAIFICFAPKENPKIAVAVFVENGGFGISAAAPVASIMIEKYLKGKVERTALKNEIIARNFSNNVISQPLSEKPSVEKKSVEPAATKSSTPNINR